MQVLVAQWGGTTVCSFQVGLFWEPGSAPLHLKRQESFIPLTNRSLPMCVFPEVIYTRCCLLWGLACSVICMWCWSCWRFVPLIADSHGLKQAFSCQCPWVAGGAGTQKATGLVKAESFLHDTQYEWLCPGPSQRAGQQPRGLGAVLYHCTDQKKGRPKH